MLLQTIKEYDSFIRKNEIEVGTVLVSKDDNSEGAIFSLSCIPSITRKYAEFQFCITSSSYVSYMDLEELKRQFIVTKKRIDIGSAYNSHQFFKIKQKIQFASSFPLGSCIRLNKSKILTLINKTDSSIIFLEVKDGHITQNIYKYSYTNFFENDVEVLKNRYKEEAIRIANIKLRMLNV